MISLHIWALFMILQFFFISLFFATLNFIFIIWILNRSKFSLVDFVFRISGLVITGECEAMTQVKKNKK